MVADISLDLSVFALPRLAVVGAWTNEQLQPFRFELVRVHEIAVSPTTLRRSFVV